MQTLRPMILGAAFATGLLLASGAQAGVVFEVETTYHSGAERGSETAEMAVDGSNLKIEILPGSGGTRGGAKDEVIYRGDRREMVVVDHKNQSYMVMDEAMVGEIGGQVQSAMKEMEKALEGLDPKQREMMEQMLKGKMGAGAAKGDEAPKTVYRKTDERATHQGYPCVRYDVFRGSEKFQELWVTDWNRVAGGDEIAKAFKDMSVFFSGIMDAFNDMMGGLSPINTGTSPIDSFAEIDGFPVVTRSFEGGELESETVMKSAKETALAPSTFEPPSGYHRQTMDPR